MGSHVVRRHQRVLRGRQEHQERWRQGTKLQLVGACHSCQLSRWNRGTGMPEEPVSRARSIAQVATVRDATARSPEPWAPHPRSWTPADAPPRPRNQAFSEQQQSTATTALSNAFGFIQMRPGQRKQGNKRLLRGVWAEAVTSHSHPAAAKCSSSRLTR